MEPEEAPALMAPAGHTFVKMANSYVEECRVNIFDSCASADPSDDPAEFDDEDDPEEGAAAAKDCITLTRIGRYSERMARWMSDAEKDLIKSLRQAGVVDFQSDELSYELSHENEPTDHCLTALVQFKDVLNEILDHSIMQQCEAKLVGSNEDSIAWSSYEDVIMVSVSESVEEAVEAWNEATTEALKWSS